MDEVIVCSAKEAIKLMEHMDSDDIVILARMNRKTHIHDKSRHIRKGNGEELIKKADNVLYQNNDFFGTLSLYGVLRDKNIVHSILFPKLE